MKSNTVKVTGLVIQSISYIAGSLVITKGQSSSPPPSITQKGADWAITLKCDRKKSTDVAMSFGRASGGNIHVYAPEGGEGGSPSQLNFYFGVTVTILSGGNKSSTNLYLGQGSHDGTNNWWIGGNDVINKGEALLIVTDNNNNWHAMSLSGTHNSFKLYPLT